MISKVGRPWLVLLIFFCGAAHAVEAQGEACSGLVELCGQQDSVLTLSSAFDLPSAATLAGQFEADYVQVVQFHTTYFNQFASPSESVTVSFQNPQCGGTLVARVFQPNPFDPCNAAEYVPASDLWSISTDTALTSYPLFQNTDYVLLIGSATGSCSVLSTLDGLAMSIDACCATTMDFGETATVNVWGSDPALGYEWTPSEQVEMAGNQEALLSPYETTTFEVTAYLEGCEYSDAVLIAVGAPVDVPNAFTPNNDADNDQWEIGGLSQFPFSTIEVFDRWGQKVYRSVSYPKPWEGKHGGRDVPEGTYYYVINLNVPNANLLPITGYVAVIR